MTDKQTELLNKAKAVMRILSPLSEGDRQAVSMIVYQLTDAENRSRMEAEHSALAAEKMAYMEMNKAGVVVIGNSQVPNPGGLGRG